VPLIAKKWVEKALMAVITAVAQVIVGESTTKRR
jgi:hypothetical protein